MKTSVTDSTQITSFLQNRNPCEPTPIIRLLQRDLADTEWLKGSSRLAGLLVLRWEQDLIDLWSKRQFTPWEREAFAPPIDLLLPSYRPFNLHLESATSMSHWAPTHFWTYCLFILYLNLRNLSNSSTLLTLKNLCPIKSDYPPHSGISLFQPLFLETTIKTFFLC